jgi:hypothetical protein
VTANPLRLTAAALCIGLTYPKERKDMFPMKATIAGLLLAVGILGWAALVPGAKPIPTDQFDLLQKLIKPPEDEAWLKIPWMIDLNEARRKAAKEGKPLIVFGTAGPTLGCT